jgi:hypothetical protein
MAAIQASEIVTHPAAAMNQTNSAGGVINSDITIASGAIGNVIEDITEAERLNGIQRHYKLFAKIGNPDNKIYKQARIFLQHPLENDYYTSLIKGDFDELWNDISANRKYGSGNLKTGTALSPGDQTLIIDTRGVSYAHFQQNDLIVITDKLDTTDITGHSEFARINQPVSWNGDEATIHFDTPLRHAYADQRVLNNTTIKTHISSCIEYGDIKAQATITDNTSAHGTTDNSALIYNHIAAISQTITIAFQDTNNFTATSNIGGITLPAGQKTVLYEPQNPTYLKPYITIPATFWTNDGAGDWAAGDTLKISTTPAAIPYWLIIDIPPSSAASDLEIIDIWTDGYSGSS